MSQPDIIWLLVELLLRKYMVMSLRKSDSINGMLKSRTTQRTWPFSLSKARRAETYSVLWRKRISATKFFPLDLIRSWKWLDRNCGHWGCRLLVNWVRGFFFTNLIPSQYSFRNLLLPVSIASVTFLYSTGWELHVPNESALKLYKAVAEAGKNFGFVNSGYRAMDSLSCEKGYRHWHADIRPDDTPLEAGLGFTCKLKTGIDFKGRQALEKQKAEGIRKKLVTVTMDDSTVPLWGLEGIKRDGDFVGFVRRAEYGVSLETNIAYGYVKKPDGSVVDKDFLSSGQWSLEVMGKDYPVKLHTKNPFDPQNNRIKGFY